MTIPMPEPDFTGLYVLDDEGFLVSAGYTPDQMQAYADARVRAALEEALAEAKRVSDKYGYGYYGSEVDAVDEVGEAIRALIPPTE